MTTKKKESAQRKKKQGKKSRASGAAFELRTRADLEKKGWRVDKWTSNVEFMSLDKINKKELKLNWEPNNCVNGVSPALGRLIPAKPKFVYNPELKKRIMIGNSSGFPDFIAFKFYRGYNGIKTYEVVGVESKSDGQLEKLEKEKCQWLLKNHVFSRVLIAKKTKVKNRIVVEYRDFDTTSVQEKNNG
ncbi:MAG TPA: hypothetical protein ENI23_13195 [bacterium]|nr:hypothetical protein [bacterium]